MKYELVLRKQPWLRLTNINDVSKRLLSRTNYECFIAFNTLQGVYELHSTRSFDASRNSANAVIDESWLNWRVVEDYLMNNHNTAGVALRDARQYKQNLYDISEKTRVDMKNAEVMETLKRTLGRRV